MPQFSFTRFLFAFAVILTFTASFYQAEAAEEVHLAQDFSLKNLEGKEVNLSQFRGKYRYAEEKSPAEKIVF